ncbi:16S rRNA (cytosine(1402)-N(4))-methyltransferase RsmH [Legionella geestiana]|uniref:16S rRNA (cytosine(1402)-N(4))-methyltransferase RsmH n=1 Tax=Legionella geestiana TaxID=45065 RepID=UPI001092AB37|nr:16S rRNA (cytosine(1402)-N(4))-methyltransferase RsmH [Legionella geestiana]QDQ39171.1 16S rRNA (cytosine(1402)-N(4))-methyltransferase RsmH [Legionella geestiana]
MHQPVMLKEVIEALAIKPDGVYVDATFGRGGHTRGILASLAPEGRVLAIDRDAEAIAHAGEVFKDEPRLHLYHGSFAELANAVEQAGLTGRVNGILMDLGVSSPQLDTPERGFSFMQDGPLDMRMDTRQPLSAARFVNEASVDEMTQVFREYGEERFSGRIARAIAESRAKAPLERTLQLAEIVKAANPRWERHKHPATRVFQAIRIHVNAEMESLKAALSQSMKVLAPEGRLAVISFHSLEDRVVKQFMRNLEQGDVLPREVPVRFEAQDKVFRRVGKAIKAGEQEVADNVRARSAVLRTGEKIR